MMILKRSKRGLHQADWAMSLGVFLIYLAWFFVVVKPVFSPDTGESIPVDDLKELFLENASWSINNTPIILRSNIESESEPVILEFPFPGSEEDYYLGEYFMIDEGYIFFLKSLQDRDYRIDLTSSGETYSPLDVSTSLRSEEGFTSNKDLTVVFEDSLIDHVRFKDIRKISSFRLFVRGIPLSTAVQEHSSNRIFGKHKVTDPLLNHSVYVFENNSRIYSLITPSKTRHVKLEMELDQYAMYFADKDSHGSINYNSSGCKEFSSDFIDFYDDYYGVSFLFDDEVDIEMCYNDTLELEFEFDAESGFWYKILFHETTENMQQHIDPYECEFGLAEFKTGLSEEKLFSLENQNYTRVKREWGFGNDFNITVIDSSNDQEFSIGAEPYSNANIYAKTYNQWMLDKFGSMERVSLVLLVW